MAGGHRNGSPGERSDRRAVGEARAGLKRHGNAGPLPPDDQVRAHDLRPAPCLRGRHSWGRRPAGLEENAPHPERHGGGPDRGHGVQSVGGPHLRPPQSPDEQPGAPGGKAPKTLCDHAPWCVHPAFSRFRPGPRSLVLLSLSAGPHRGPRDIPTPSGSPGPATCFWASPWPLRRLGDILPWPAGWTGPSP